MSYIKKEKWSVFINPMAGFSLSPLSRPLEGGLQLKILTPSKSRILKLNVNKMNLNCLSLSKHDMFICSQVSLEKFEN